MIAKIKAAISKRQRYMILCQLSIQTLFYLRSVSKKQRPVHFHGNTVQVSEKELADFLAALDAEIAWRTSSSRA